MKESNKTKNNGTTIKKKYLKVFKPYGCAKKKELNFLKVLIENTRNKELPQFRNMAKGGLSY